MRRDKTHLSPLYLYLCLSLSRFFLQHQIPTRACIYITYAARCLCGEMYIERIADRESAYSHAYDFYADVYRGERGTAHVCVRAGRFYGAAVKPRFIISIRAGLL